MLYTILLFLSFVFGWSSAASQIPLQISGSPSSNVHIFNSVSSALRQWGNTLNPNGASFVPGIIRPHTTLYHARINPDEPLEPEWLAFDAEMSFGIFGNAWGRPPGTGRTRDTWMRSYSSKREIKVGYFDGMSAMISRTGTFDFEDLMGFGPGALPSGPWGVFAEYTRAGVLCNWTKEADLGLDGFVRMNAGFELIVCDWSAWELLSNVNVTRVHQGMGEPFYEWARSASWHNFMPEGRVELDWSAFISAHGRGVELDPRSANESHRMISMSNATLRDIKDELESVLRRPLFSKRGTNWQSVADSIIQRYSPRVLQIHSALSKNSTNQTDIEAAAAAVHIALVPYYDSTLSDRGLDKCINGFTYGLNRSELTDQEKKIYDSVIYVLARICHTFYDLFHILPSPNGTAVSTVPFEFLQSPHRGPLPLIETLHADLQLPSFTTCPVSECPTVAGSFCALAMWPVIWGTRGEDWPRCLGKEDFERGPGWGGRGPYRRPGPYGPSGPRPPPGGGPGGGRRPPGNGPGGGPPPEEGPGRMALWAAVTDVEEWDEEHSV